MRNRLTIYQGFDAVVKSFSGLGCELCDFSYFKWYFVFFFRSSSLNRTMPFLERHTHFFMSQTKKMNISAEEGSVSFLFHHRISHRIPLSQHYCSHMRALKHVSYYCYFLKRREKKRWLNIYVYIFWIVWPHLCHRIYNTHLVNINKYNKHYYWNNNGKWAP